MSEPVIIVGAGVSGLTLAYRLQRAGQPSVVFEKGSSAGGNIRTARHDGFLYDVGPDSFVKAKPEAAELCRALGLGPDLIEPLPGGRHVFVARDGALQAMPEGLTLGVPQSPKGLIESGALSGLGKARAFCEPFVPKPAGPGSDESIASFLGRRLGPEMAERLAAPLLSGVFAGDAERLSMAATFPQLAQLEERFGSLLYGMKAPRGSNAALDWRAKARILWSALVTPTAAHPSPFYSLRQGMGQLISALVEALAQPSSACAELRLQTEVASLICEGNLIRGVRLASGEAVLGRHVVLAGPPWAASRVLRASLPQLSSELGSIAGAPTATVFLGLETDAVEHKLDGSGFIVPPGEGEILASTWTSRKWAHRAPAGQELVRAFLGGARRVGPSIEAASDAELADVAVRELRRFMGNLGPIRFVRVYRYTRGTPQPELGHLARLSRIQGLVRASEGLSLIGPGYAGVGIPDCIRGATEKAAELVRGELVPSA